MKVGDCVRLTERAAKGRNACQHPRRVDWSKRLGVIARINWAYAYVVWHGLRSAEPCQLDSVETSSKGE